ncbi:MAG: hypothetical protein M3443_04815 [Actinomycetota bacterium]|nr:hypothetical protein [Actinomycetota bacterium]
MSRAQQNSAVRPRLAPAALGLGLAAILSAVVGCSAGQITQTDSQLPAVNGVQTQSGVIAVRDATLAYPHGGSYPKGADAPLVLTFVNTGTVDDELIEVTSPLAAEVKVTGDKALPGTRALSIGTRGEEARVEKSAPATTPTPTATKPAESSSAAPTSTPPSSGEAPSTAPTTSAPTTSAKVEIGKAEIVLIGLNAKLVPGQLVPVTFVFKSGSVTIELPFAAPSTPRAEGEHGESEH